jgi:hypothetical protein
MNYRLRVSSYIGLVPWATHFTGRVRGEDAPLCHGTTEHFNAPGHRGISTCDEGHEILKPIEWDVEAAWTEARYERYSAAHFEGNGPNQFSTEQEVIDRAIVAFLDGQNGMWWAEIIEPAKQGDRLLDEYGNILAICNRG